MRVASRALEHRATLPFMEEPRSTPSGRLLLAFEMADLGIALMRENLRRRDPKASFAELDQAALVQLV